MASPCAVAGTGGGTTADSGFAGAGFDVTGVGSLFTGSGTLAGAGAAGVVSVGLVACELEGVSAVAVGVGSSFLDFFLKRPLNAFFICSIASGAKSYVSCVDFQ